MTILLNSVLVNALLATVLALLVWIVTFIPAVCRRPGLRHVLWVIVLLKLVTPPMLEVSILPASFVAKPKGQMHPRAVPLDEIPRDDPGEWAVVTSSDIPLETPRTVPPARGIEWMIVLAVVSGLGTLTVLLLSLRQVWKLRRALARGASDDERLGAIGRQSAQHMGLSAPPTVCGVSANVSPLLWVRRSGPLVVIPRRLADQMSDEQLRCVVSHEIAHYLRRDHWTNLLSLLVAAVCWWNPVVWWARRELRIAQEACCDALVLSRSVATRRTYAETLLQALDFIQAAGSLSPALASSFGGKSSTQRRFEMIANPRVNHRLSWWSYPVLVAALAALLCVPVRGQSDEPKDSESPQRSRPLSATGEDADTYLSEIRSEYLGEVYDESAYPGEMGYSAGIGYGDTESKRDSRKARYRLPDYLPAAHGNAVSAGGDRYYGLNPCGSDRIWHVHYFQDTGDGFGKTLWDATLKLPPEGDLKQGDTFVLNTSKGIVTLAVVEDDYDNDRDIGVKQIDVKTGAIKDERTLLRHMARYQSFLESMQGEDDETKENKDEPAPQDGKADDGKNDAGGQPTTMSYEEWDRTFGFNAPIDMDVPNVRWVGNDMILEQLSAEGPHLFDSTLELWHLFRGDAPEQIQAFWEDGKIRRMIIKGKSGSPRHPRQPRSPGFDHGKTTESPAGRPAGSASEKDDSSGIPGSPPDTP